MKKILYTIMAMFIFLPSVVFAEGYVSVSPGSLDMEVGSSKTFSIIFYNTIGDVSIASSNSSVASVSTGEWGTGMIDEKQTKSTVITVYGGSVGSATITVSIDAATFDGEDLAGQTRQVTVNVREKTVAPPPAPPVNNNNNNSNNNTGNNNQNNLSGNNKLKEILVDGYDLVKVDDNNYNLTVSNNVTNVNIKATAEDEKATINGVGKRDLVVGENILEVAVKAESGAINVIKLKVIRKDGFYLEDLNNILKDVKDENIDIIIKEDSLLTKDKLETIKNSKKKVTLNFYNEDKKLIYSWIIDGKLIKDTSDFMTKITFESANTDAISNLANYADGMYINIHQDGKLPKGIKLKLFVGQKYKNDSLVNVYSYNKSSDELKEIKEQLKVVDGYIEYEIEKDNEQFITMSTVNNNVVAKDNSGVFLIISIIEFIVIVALLVVKKGKIVREA